MKKQRKQPRLPKPLNGWGVMEQDGSLCVDFHVDRHFLLPLAPGERTIRCRLVPVVRAPKRRKGAK